MFLTAVVRNLPKLTINNTKNGVQCTAVSATVKRWQSTDTEDSETEKVQTTVSQKFVNRNPRNLELLGLAWKKKGWKFHYPSKEFYHRISLIATNRHTEAFVEHMDGKKVISCSTKEIAIRKHLYSATDISAARNVGRILAHRCIESGLNEVSLLELENAEQSEKFQAFKAGLMEVGLGLTEPTEAELPYEQGIDYDDTEKMEELIERQRKVWTLGRKSLVTRWLADQKTFKPRRRPIRAARPMESPSFTYLS